MGSPRQRGEKDARPSRRDTLRLGAAGALALAAGALAGDAPQPNPALAEAVSRLLYLTPPDAFREFGSETPRIDSLPPAKLREVGLDRESWRLEVVPDRQSNAQVANALSCERGTAMDWAGLMGAMGPGLNLQRIGLTAVDTCT
jgi:hypothetical protein